MVDISKFGLGRNKSPLDIRDYQLAAYIPRVIDISGGREWAYQGLLLNQRDHPHCGGFGLANFCNNDPINDFFLDADGIKFYKLCKDIDGESGQENGTSIRSVAKVAKQIGRIANYAFAYSVDEIAWWILNKGPVILGTDWTNDMFVPDARNIIHPTGEVVGGHCYEVNAKTVDGLFRIHNSWGDNFGINGEAFISMDDLARLLRAGGEAVTAVELPLAEDPAPIPIQENGCSKLWYNIVKALGGA
jgi:hypothetical protein